jgi:rhamnogalacturonan II specific xylosyltransferase
VNQRSDGLFPINEVSSSDTPSSRPSMNLVVHLPSNDFLVMMSVSTGYRDFSLNWWHYYQKMLLPNQLILLAEDDEIYDHLKAFDFGTSIVLIERSPLRLNASGDWNYNSDEYKQLASLRPLIIWEQLQNRPNNNILFADVDAVWLKNPFDYIDASSDNATELWFQAEFSNHTISPKTHVCAGFMGIRNNENMRALIKEWQKRMEKIPDRNQKSFNNILRNEFRHVVVKHLPLFAFPSGWLYFNVMNDSERTNTVVVHNNWIVGHDKKLKRFQEYGLWSQNEIHS